MKIKIGDIYRNKMINGPIEVTAILKNGLVEVKDRYGSKFFLPYLNLLTIQTELEFEEERR